MVNIEENILGWFLWSTES